MSAIHLLIILFVFGLGGFFISLYFYPNLLFCFINIIINKPHVILKLGFFVLLLAVILFVLFYLINKAQYVKFVMKKNNYQVDTKLIKTYIDKYFEKILSSKFDVCVLPKDKLEIIATVDSLDNNEEFLLNIEEKIGELLSEHLNYQKEFIFTLKSK
jgi:hypothetical protein